MFGKLRGCLELFDVVITTTFFDSYVVDSGGWASFMKVSRLKDNARAFRIVEGVVSSSSMF